MTVNKKLLEYIEKERISQTDLAKKLKIAPPNLHRILNAKDIRVSQLVKICKELGVEPYVFFDNAPSASNAEIEDYKMQLEAYREMIEDTANDITNLIEDDAKHAYTKDEIRNVVKTIIYARRLQPLLEGKLKYEVAKKISSFKKKTPKSK